MKPLAREAEFVESRRILVEALDTLVRRERVFHATYGYYTHVLSRVAFALPIEIASEYDVHVAEASADHLRIVATSERRQGAEDWADVSEDFAFHATFPLPRPSAEHLRRQALWHLRSWLNRPDPADPIHSEQTVFRDYFHYLARKDAQGRPVALAVGTRDPVSGITLEETSAPSPESPGLIASSIGDDRQPDVFLARIFRQETGRTPRDPEELEDGLRIRAAILPPLSGVVAHEDRAPASERGSSGAELEIEKVSPDE